MPQNSRGDDEPFISAASVIAEARSHGRNHLLECLEIGSAEKKTRDSGQVALVQGNLCKCRSRKFPRPVLSHASVG